MRLFEAVKVNVTASQAAAYCGFTPKLPSEFVFKFGGIFLCSFFGRLFICSYEVKFINT